MTKARKQGANGTSKWPADLVERWPIDRLIPYARNARTHDGAQIAQIAAAIREWGWTMPILVGEDGTIIAGHGRVLAARMLGLTECPVMVAAGWTEAQKRAYGIADNKLALNAGWDEDLLKIELEDLRSSGYDLTPVGFSAEELAAICDVGAVGATDPDEVPEVATGPATARAGDLWALGRHRLLCGDATNAEDTQKVLGGVSPHLMVTDPPYGVNYDPKWRDQLDDLSRARGQVQNDDRADWCEAWALFPGDVAYCWSPGGDQQMVHCAALVAAGFDVRTQIIWTKPHFVIGRGNYHIQHEPCWYAVRKGKTAHWGGDRTQSTVWQISNALFQGKGGQDPADKFKSGHGTQASA